MAKTLDKQIILVAVVLTWSLALPYIPTAFFDLVDNILGVLLLLLAVLLSLPYGPVVGVLTILAAALTFAERNRRKIQTKILNPSPNLQEQLKPAPPLRPDEIHPQFETTEPDALPFAPQEDTGVNEFHAADTGLDDKHPIPTMAPDSDLAERFYISRDLGHTELAP